jgi:hypothetical protein
MKRTTEEVIGEITRFLSGIGGAYDWDDFLTIPIKDQRLNAIRIECLDLREKFPPESCRQYCSDEGLERLRGILKGLQSH